MEETAKRFTSKNQVHDLDIADKIARKSKKIQMFELSYSNCRRYFDNDGSQNHLIFQPIFSIFPR